MRKTGILGGTFNPVHNAHIRIAQEAKRTFSLDRIIFLPSGQPPHKNANELVSAKHRCNMISAAIAGMDGFELSNYEAERNCICYTADTMKYFYNNFPEDEFYFIIGGDSLNDFSKWRHPEQIVRYTKLLACSRNGMNYNEIQIKIDELTGQFGADIKYFDVEAMAVSSHEIRKLILNGAPADNFLPEPVIQYINKYHLYREPSSTGE